MTKTNPYSKENYKAILVPDAQVLFESWTTPWNGGVTLHMSMRSTVALDNIEPSPFSTSEINYESSKDAMEVQSYTDLQSVEYKLQSMLKRETVVWCNDTETILPIDYYENK